jgi:hypothetical protein
MGAMVNQQTHQPNIPPEPDTFPAPLFIRIPASGSRCPYCGLSRSSLDKLTRPQAANHFKPPVKSRLYQQSGVVAKVRLIDFKSLRAYLHGLPDGQQPLNLKKRRQPPSHEPYKAEAPEDQISGASN